MKKITRKLNSLERFVEVVNTIPEPEYIVNYNVHLSLSRILKIWNKSNPNIVYEWTFYGDFDIYSLGLNFIQKPKEYFWKPKEKEQYYYVCSFNDVTIGNYHQENVYRPFKTREEAEKYAAYRKAEEILREAIANANKGWTPDFTDNRQENYFVYIYEDNLACDSAKYSKYFNSFMYIKSYDAAKQLMEKYEKEFITYLSY